MLTQYQRRLQTLRARPGAPVVVLPFVPAQAQRVATAAGRLEDLIVRRGASPLIPVAKRGIVPPRDEIAEPCDRNHAIGLALDRSWADAHRACTASDKAGVPARADARRADSAGEEASHRAWQRHRRMTPRRPAVQRLGSASDSSAAQSGPLDASACAVDSAGAHDLIVRGADSSDRSGVQAHARARPTPSATAVLVRPRRRRAGARGAWRQHGADPGPAVRAQTTNTPAEARRWPSRRRTPS